MADVGAIPFINFGESQAKQAEASASAGLKNQQAGLVDQQAQQAQMATELQRRAMPLYRQNIDDMMADMSGTTASNAAAATGETTGAAGESGVNYSDSGAIAEHLRQQNFVQPITEGEMRRIKQGALAAAMPGGNPAFLEQAKLQQSFRVQQQTAAAQYRSGQTYDVMTAVAAPDNKNPLGALRAIPGQDAVVAQIVADHPGDEAAQQDAARKYAQMTAFHVHQYTGNKQDMENGVLVDTTKGAPVTGQDQVLTGLNPEQRSKVMQYAYEPIKVTFTDGSEQMMPRWKAPKDQGGLGMSPEAFLARQDAAARRHLNDPSQPEPGSGSWDHPSAVGNNDGADAATAGNGAHAVPPKPATKTVRPAPGARPATGAALQQVRAQPGQGLPTPPSPATAVKGPVPPIGTPEYGQRMTAAMQDPAYNAKWGNLPHMPGAAIPGAKEGVTEYNKQRTELLQAAGDSAKSADQALQNFNAAKAIFDATQPLTGPIGALAQRVAASLGVDIGSSAGRQEVAKYLVNGAVSGLKETYGSRPGVFDVKINVEQAFPNIEKMTPGAVRNLIDSQISQAQYIKDSAHRAVAYANNKKEPNSFGEWNGTYFPRAELLSPTRMETQAKGAWGAYEPDKYEYRTTSEGKLQRRAKQ